MGPFTLFSVGVMAPGTKGISIPRVGLPGYPDTSGSSPPPPPTNTVTFDGNTVTFNGNTVTFTA